MSDAALADFVEAYAESARRTLDDPEWFIREVLRYKPLPWQLQAVNAVLDPRRKALGLPTVVNHDAKPRVSIRSCHGTGKTEGQALILHVWNFSTPGLVPCTAPKQDQLLRRFLPRYRKLLRGAEPDYAQWVQVLGTSVVCFGDRDWGAVMETATDPDNLAGYHDQPQLFLVDEAGAKRLDPMFPVIEGALTTPGSVVVEIGNPTRTSGAFYDHHNRPGVREHYYLMHVKHTDARKLISREWVEHMGRTYGKDSPIYKIRVLGEFAAFDEYTLIPLELVEDTLDTALPPDGSQPKVRVSIDVADGGADKTVCTVGLHYATHVQIVRQLAYSHPPKLAPLLAAEEGIRLFEAFGGKIDGTDDDFVVDANGVGSGTAGALMQKGYRVVCHIGSEGAPPFKNRRTANYLAFERAHREGTLAISPGAIDDEEEYRAHVTSVKRASSDKVDEIETKDKMKRDGLPSPDRADSASMQFIDKAAGVVADNLIEGYGSNLTGTYDGGLS